MYISTWCENLHLVLKHAAHILVETRCGRWATSCAPLLWLVRSVTLYDSKFTIAALILISAHSLYAVFGYLLTEAVFAFHCSADILLKT